MSCARPRREKKNTQLNARPGDPAERRGRCAERERAAEPAERDEVEARVEFLEPLLVVVVALVDREHAL